MEAGQSRNALIAAGVVAGLAFVLIELTGSPVDRQASETMTTAVAVVLFSVMGSAGVALTYLQPRFALLGVITAMLALLACGAVVVSIWSNGPFIFGLALNGSAGTAGGITALLSIAASAACVLLATVRPGEDAGTRAVRMSGVGALTLFTGLAILAIVDHGVDIGARTYAIIATVYVVAGAVSLLLRLLPIEEDPITVTAPQAP